MSLALIRSHLQTGGEHVGDMVWWTLEDARIGRTRLEEVWTGNRGSPLLRSSSSVGATWTRSALPRSLLC